MTRPGDPPPEPLGPDAPLRLRPISGPDVPTGGHPAQHPPAPALAIRPLAADAGELAVEPPADPSPIEVLDPDGILTAHATATRLNPHHETRLARFVARRLRSTRDWLYLVSLALLVVTLVGFLFQLKAVLHLGAVGVVAANILMLVDGVLYLMVVPFRTSLAEGLGVLLVPPYSVYYWIKHWDRMRRPLFSTVGSFLPIAVAGLAYLLYQESPAILREVEKAERAIGIEPGASPVPQPRQPSVADQAKQVLGNEANIIQELAKPQ